MGLMQVSRGEPALSHTSTTPLRLDLSSGSDCAAVDDAQLERFMEELREQLFAEPDPARKRAIWFAYAKLHSQRSPAVMLAMEESRGLVR